MYKVLIFGAGQLGSRYMQGLQNSKYEIDIYVFDISLTSIEKAKQQLREVASSKGNVHFSNRIEVIPTEIDIAIISTTADVRAGCVERLAKNSIVQYWILEKVLTQNLSDLKRLAWITKDSRGVWVNTPRRMMNWHKAIKPHIGTNQSGIDISLNGGKWGMACNAVHYIDLISWWWNCSLEFIDTSGLRPEWKKAKREGFWEVFGELKLKFSNSINATFICESQSFPKIIKCTNDSLIWTLDEDGGYAYSNEGLEILGEVELQSTMSAKLVDGILEFGECDLPDLADNLNTHEILIKALLAHWQKNMDPRAKSVPIT